MPWLRPPFRDEPRSAREAPSSVSDDFVRSRLALLEYAATHALDDVLQKAVDVICGLTGSPVGFLHFIDQDQASIWLQAWSTRTRNEFCHVEGERTHYPLERAGVWADCLRTRAPVVHNDYASLPGRKGMPPGHATVVRELVVPVMRAGRVVAILGVGNKPHDYDDRDVELVDYFADVTWEVVAHKRAEEELRRSESRYALTLDALNDGLWDWDVPADRAFFSANYYSMLGYEVDAFPASRVAWRQLVHPDDLERAEGLLQAAIDAGQGINIDLRMRTKGGDWLWACIRGKAVAWDEDGRALRMVGTLSDISERKRAEHEIYSMQEALSQAQKMQSVGQLAGGIAHDFNNMLAVILGHLEMAIASTDPRDPLSEHLSTVLDAAQRSANLTRQLLAFARKQKVAPKVLDLNAAVDPMLAMLRRLMGEEITLTWLPEPGVWRVRVDPSQIDQVLANLCVNARAAITGVGQVVIRSQNVGADHATPDRLLLGQGDYVMLSVSDTGCGMDAATRGRIFEPFFTTKGVGEGTGLGLSTVYGIVKQNGGAIGVVSEPSHGTTFRLYFPRHREEAHPPRADPAAAAATATRHHETILLVEDEPAVLRMVGIMLERLGYAVLPAGGPSEALQIAATHAARIDLVLSDVMMPEMNGRDLVERLLERHPHFKWLCMSAYTSNVLPEGIDGEANVPFLQKPFSMLDLDAKLRQALNRAGG